MKFAECFQPEPVILFGSFPLDLIGRTPERLAERLELGDWTSSVPKVVVNESSFISRHALASGSDRRQPDASAFRLMD